MHRRSIDLYITTGTASDWFYGDDASQTNKGFRAAGFTIELRDTGRYGFLLPPEQIIPTGEEITAAAIFFIGAALVPWPGRACAGLTLRAGCGATGTDFCLKNPLPFRG